MGQWPTILLVLDSVITVVETRPFMKAAADLMTDREREGFISFIARYPASGAIVKGSGGVRKARWAAKGRGKSGGVRVIYYYHSQAVPLFLLRGCSKINS